MKLKDLIPKLQALNPDAEVMLECPDTNWGAEILGANGVGDSTPGHPTDAGRVADAADMRVILVSGRYLPAGEPETDSYTGHMQAEADAETK